MLKFGKVYRRREKYLSPQKQKSLSEPHEKNSDQGKKRAKGLSILNSRRQITKIAHDYYYYYHYYFLANCCINNDLINDYK